MTWNRPNHYFKEMCLKVATFPVRFILYLICYILDNVIFEQKTSDLCLCYLNWHWTTKCICESCQEATNTLWILWLEINTMPKWRHYLLTKNEVWPLVFLKYIAPWFSSGRGNVGVNQLHTITDNYRPRCCLTAEFSTECLQVQGCFRAPWTFKCTQMSEEPSSGA